MSYPKGGGPSSFFLVTERGKAQRGLGRARARLSRLPSDFEGAKSPLASPNGILLLILWAGKLFFGSVMGCACPVFAIRLPDSALVHWESSVGRG